MLATTELDYVQHLERGYCVNHPDVVAQTKAQVVDRAVKQLLTALQTNGFELDGNILKRGNGWLQYDNVTSKWQYSNNAGVTWQDMSAVVAPGLHIITTNYQILSTEVNGDVFIVLNSGVTLTLPVGVPDGSQVTIYSSSLGTTINPTTGAKIIILGAEGAAGQTLIFDHTTNYNMAIQLALITDIGFFGSVGDKVWLAITQLGEFTWGA